MKKTTTKTTMTLKDAINAGYTMGDVKWERGYISRKIDINNQPVHTAGGRRKGELYVLIPSYTSTTYCHRRYLVKS